MWHLGGAALEGSSAASRCTCVLIVAATAKVEPVVDTTGVAVSQLSATTVVSRGWTGTASGTNGTKTLDAYQTATAAERVFLVGASHFVVGRLVIKEVVVATRETLPSTVAAASRG